MPKKTQLFFPAKSARPGSKERHQKDILKLKPNLSMKISTITFAIIHRQKLNNGGKITAKFVV